MQARKQSLKTIGLTAAYGTVEAGALIRQNGYPAPGLVSRAERNRLKERKK